MDTNKDVNIGQELTAGESQHQHQHKLIYGLRERITELERLVRILSEGHGLTEEIRPTPDKGHWNEVRH